MSEQQDFSADQLVSFWRAMLRIRSFGQAALYQSSIGKIYGALHSCEGQESCCVGVCSALQKKATTRPRPIAAMATPRQWVRAWTG